MARPKKATTTKKTTTRKASTRGKAKTKQSKGLQRTPKAQSGDPRVAVKRVSSAKPLQSNVGNIKMLKSTPTTKRPPNNPDIPQNIITMLNQD
jgi:hypothetical protein